MEVFARGFKQPRTLRVAPNGDVFLSESGTGRVLLFRANRAGAGPAKAEVFAENLDRRYGIVFVPPANPKSSSTTGERCARRVNLGGHAAPRHADRAARAPPRRAPCASATRSAPF